MVFWNLCWSCVSFQKNDPTMGFTTIQISFKYHCGSFLLECLFSFAGLWNILFFLPISHHPGVDRIFCNSALLNRSSLIRWNWNKPLIPDIQCRPPPPPEAEVELQSLLLPSYCTWWDSRGETSPFETGCNHHYQDATGNMSWSGLGNSNLNYSPSFKPQWIHSNCLASTLHVWWFV